MHMHTLQWLIDQLLELLGTMHMLILQRVFVPWADGPAGDYAYAYIAVGG